MSLKQYTITRMVNDDKGRINKVISINTTDDLEAITFDWDGLEWFSNSYGEINLKPGIYFLKGWCEKEEKTMFYVGESNTLIKRLKQHKHSKEMDWVKEACVFYRGSQNQFLSKNELEYIEAIFISIVENSDELILVNKNGGKDGSPIGKERKLIIGEHLDSIIHKLDILDWSEFLYSRKVKDPNKKNGKNTVMSSQQDMPNRFFGVEDETDKTKMFGVFNPYTNETVVFKNSKGFGINLTKDQKVREEMIRFLNNLSQNGNVKIEYSSDLMSYDFEFLEHYNFSSPSAAGWITKGRKSCNGWIYWKLSETGERIDSLRAAR